MKSKKTHGGPKNKRKSSNPSSPQRPFLSLLSALSNSIYQGRGSIAWGLVLAAVTCVGFYGYRGVVFSNAFAVNNIVVTGASPTFNQSVKDQLEVFENKNIYRIRLYEIEKNLEENPWIKSADVTRAGLHSLEVEVEKQKAVAVLNLNGFYLIDKDGKPFKRTRSTSEEMEGLVVVSGLKRRDLKEHSEWVDEKMKTFLKLLLMYKTKVRRPSLSEVVFTADEGAIFYTYESGAAINVGKLDQKSFKEKLHAFDDAWMALSESEKEALTQMQISKDSSSVTVTFKES